MTSRLCTLSIFFACSIDECFFLFENHKILNLPWRQDGGRNKHLPVEEESEENDAQWIAV
jgi:hypothetical protein